MIRRSIDFWLASGIAVLITLPLAAPAQLKRTMPPSAPLVPRPKVTLPLNLKDPGYGTMYLTTRLGSFSLRDGIGRVELNFTGTLLVSQLDGRVLEVSGRVRKEFEGKGRVVYFGTGRVVLEGGFRKIQWFGKDLSAKWIGIGLAQLYGEFDKDLQTGYIWYASNPEKIDWGTTGMTFENPERKFVGTGKPIPRPKKPPTGG